MNTRPKAIMYAQCLFEDQEKHSNSKADQGSAESLLDSAVTPRPAFKNLLACIKRDRSHTGGLVIDDHRVLATAILTTSSVNSLRSGSHPGQQKLTSHSPERLWHISTPGRLAQ